MYTFGFEVELQLGLSNPQEEHTGQSSWTYCNGLERFRRLGIDVSYFQVKGAGVGVGAGVIGIGRDVDLNLTLCDMRVDNR